MTSLLEAVHVPIFQRLREITSEASSRTYWEGHLFPTGLQGYHNHLKPNTDADPRITWDWYAGNEKAISDRLAELLNRDGSGLRVMREVAYTHSRGDLLIMASPCDRMLVEVKPVYWMWLEANGSFTRNGIAPGYLSSLTRGGSVAADFHKLRRLDTSIAEYAAILLLGFDIRGSGRFTISAADIARMKRNAKYSSDIWVEHHAAWDDVHQTSFWQERGVNVTVQVQVWFWWRKVTHS